MRLQLTKYMLREVLFICMLLTLATGFAQQQYPQEPYQKRVLESTEIDFLSSYYQQDGENAAVTGGIGTEELTDVTGNVIITIPLNANDILSIDAGVSAYTSASSSNVNPFDGPADPFVASSGASGNDVWSSAVFNYSHSSDDRNQIWGARFSVATEYDYFSLGAGGSYTRLFNQKNTELSIRANAYFDRWTTIYPIELRPFDTGGSGLNDPLFALFPITGESNYNPDFTGFSDKGRNSYTLGFGFSQILSKNIQGSLALDLISQQGLLSTPFQRVYFQDVPDSFMDGFHLAEDIERLPDNRFKIAIGGRLNYFLNASLSIRTYYRFYTDDWGLSAHTAQLEIPWKLTDRFTLYPSYRYYSQGAADYFNAYNEHLSTAAFYTSDFDLSGYNANQYGLGLGYTDIFTGLRLFHFGLKSIQVKYYYYDRNSPFSSHIVTAGFNFVLDN